MKPIKWTLMILILSFTAYGMIFLFEEFPSNENLHGINTIAAIFGLVGLAALGMGLLVIVWYAIFTPLMWLFKDE